jgi:pyridoxamine 5'-phosphate oxidase-like protein
LDPRPRGLGRGATAHGAAFFLGAVGPDATPHAAGIGTVWADGTLWFVTGPRTRKARNLPANLACTISCRLPGINVVLGGRAERAIDAGTIERLAAVYREGCWPAEAEADAFTTPYSAPSAGPPPWHLCRVTVHTASGVATAEPHGASRWRFDR